MRQPFSYIVAIILLQLNTSLALDMQSILSNIVWSMSRLPGFILDLNHPWINEHRASIELLSDPTDALCSLNSTMRNGPHKHRYPADLYKYLEIDNNKAGVSRRGWSNAISRLREMLACPAALNDVEHLKVSIYVHHGPYVSGIQESLTPPKEVLDLFVQALSSMPHLKKLEWDTFRKGTEEFKHGFQDANLELPSVRQVVAGQFYDFLVDACSNTEDLRSGGSSTSDYFRDSTEGDSRAQLIESTKQLTNLTTFGMQGEWEINHLEELLKTSPGLKTLLIDGEIASRYGSFGRRGEKAGDILKKYLDVLARFEKLENLRLPSASRLGLGFDGGPWCGNAYMGPGGRRLSRQVSLQSTQTTDWAGNLTMNKLRSLKTLEIGSYCTELSTAENGSRKASWPWSDLGIAEWIHEQFPDVDEPMTVYHDDEDDDDVEIPEIEDDERDSEIEEL